MHKIKFISLLIVFLVNILGLPLNVFGAQNISINNDNFIDNNLNRTVLKEIELSRFNELFKYENTKTSRLFPYRYFAGQESSAAGLNAGLIVGLVAREEHLNKPKLIHPVTLEYSLFPQMIGQYIGGCEPIYELMLKSRKYYSLKRNGLIPSLAIKHVEQLNGQINSIVNLNPASTNEIFNQEYKVIKLLQESLYLEYKQFHVTARLFNIFQNSSFVMDSAKNLTGAIGNMIGVISIYERQPKINGPAFLLTTVSGSLIVLGPLVSRLNRAILSYRLQKEFNSDVENEYINKLAQYINSYNKLTKIIKTHPESIINKNSLDSRLSFYKHQENIFKTSLDQIKANKKTSKKLALAQIPVGLVVGSTKIALGVCGMIAGFKFFHDPDDAQTLVADGSIPYICGTGISMVDNLRILGISQVDYFKNKKANKLPYQIYDKYLDNLDKVELNVKANIIK